MQMRESPERASGLPGPNTYTPKTMSSGDALSPKPMSSDVEL